MCCSAVCSKENTVLHSLPLWDQAHFLCRENNSASLERVGLGPASLGADFQTRFPPPFDEQLVRRYKEERRREAGFEVLLSLILFPGILMKVPSQPTVLPLFFLRLETSHLMS